MIKSKKIQFFLIVSLIIIISVIVGRHFITKHFVKKFSKMPPPGVIVNAVSKSTFYESIETFGTALSLKNKNYRIKKSEILNENIIIGKVVEEGEVIFETSDKKIVAPFKGILGKREIAQGVLGTESFILTLDDTTSILLNIKVPEIYLNILKPGLSAEVKSDSYEKKFYGTIESVSDKKEQLGIPENSLLIQGETAFVYKVLEDNTVNKIKVKIGKRNFGKVSIIDGLSLGDKIVTEGISKVRDKIKIKILN